jgi:hypothetical protein
MQVGIQGRVLFYADCDIVLDVVPLPTILLCLAVLAQHFDFEYTLGEYTVLH